MSCVRSPFGRTVIAVVLFGWSGLVTGCGGGGGDGETVAQSAKEVDHAKKINETYSQDYAAKYSRKGAAKKR